MYPKPPSSSQGSKPIEPIGILPRSIIRTLDRFRLQLFPSSTPLGLKEFQISRYQVLVSVQCLVSLIFIPLIVTLLAKTFILRPFISYTWNTKNHDIFLNSSLEKEALMELQNFEDEVFFEYFLSPSAYETPLWASYQLEAIEVGSENQSALNNPPDFLKSKLQKKTVELAVTYNQKSIDALINLSSDFCSFGIFAVLTRVFKVQIIIFKSFVLESLYSLSDTTKSFLLIFSMDLLVGFHSPRGWELILESSFNRIGFPHDEHLIYLIVATLPVVLDTVFKYWIFRYLNKISPSTVATYHAMIE